MLDISTIAIKYQVSSNHLYSEIGDEAVILDLDSGVYYGLNDVGVDIWKLLQQPQTKESILKSLLEKYEVSVDLAGKDLESILKEMLSAGLIEIIR